MKSMCYALQMQCLHVWHASYIYLASEEAATMHTSCILIVYNLESALEYKYVCV